MTEVLDHQAGGVSFQIRCLQALDDDPLFKGAGYTFAVEGGDRGFEVQVGFATTYVHLLVWSERLGLERQASRLVARLLDDGVREATKVRVSADGVAMRGDEVLEVLLPLVKKELPPKPAAC